MEMSQKAVNSSLYNCLLLPVVDGLCNNLGLLASLPCKYPLGLLSLPHKLCSEFFDVWKSLVLSGFIFLVG